MLTIFTQLLLQGETIELYEDGSSQRDFIHVADAVRGIECALHADVPSGIYNIGAGQGYSVSDVAHMLVELTATEHLPVLTGKYRAGDIRHCVADMAKAGRDWGFEAKMSIEEGLREFFAHASVVGEPSHSRYLAAKEELVRRGLYK